MESLSLTVVQTDLAWESAKRNLKNISALLDTLKNSSDIIVLPEMFNTGFTSNISAAEPLNGETMNWMKELALKHNSVITGTIAVKHNGMYYNMLIWMYENGEYGYFPKKHLFSPGKEHSTYSPGNERIIFNCKGWKILPLICYDLRFPAWSINEVENETFAYDLLIYTANWPTVRDEHWTALLRARAIENMSYVAGCNRTGIDGNNYSHNGNSMIINPLGKIISCAGEDKVKVISQTLSKTELSSYRRSFPVWKDWDKINII